MFLTKLPKLSLTTCHQHLSTAYYLNVTDWDRLILFSATITGIDAEVLAGEVRKRRGTVFMHEKGEVSFFLEASF